MRLTTEEEESSGGMRGMPVLNRASNPVFESSSSVLSENSVVKSLQEFLVGPPTIILSNNIQPEMPRRV
jgi:hypothetical protein